MPIKVYYKNKETEPCTIRPTPFVSVSENILKNKEVDIVCSGPSSKNIKLSKCQILTINFLLSQFPINQVIFVGDVHREFGFHLEQLLSQLDVVEFAVL